MNKIYPKAKAVSNCDGSRNGRMRPVIDQLEVLVTEIKNTFYLGIDLHLRWWQGLSLQLLICLLQVVHIQVRITQRVDELAGRLTGHPGHHHGEQGIGGDVEWFSDIHVFSQIASGNFRVRYHKKRN